MTQPKIFRAKDKRTIPHWDPFSVQEFRIEQKNERLFWKSVEVLKKRFEGENMEQPGLLVMCSSLYGGGAERVACHLANGFAKDYRVYLLYSEDKGRTYPLCHEAQTIAMPAFAGTGWETKMKYRIRFAEALKQLLKIRVSVSFMFTMNKINVHSRTKEIVICSERNSPRKRYPDFLEEITGLYEKADHVVFQSAEVQNIFPETVKEHSSIILNPVEVSSSKTVSKPRIVNVARLVPQKNQALLVHAFASFHEDHPDYSLSFYGGGELLKELESLTDELHLGDAICFHGQVSDVHEAIADAEMFVLSSDYEGLSNSLLEAMMMGLPCISTRCEGSNEVIQDGENGILVGIGNRQQLAEAMCRLADDPVLREDLGKNACKTSEQFAKDRIIEQWKQLVRDLIQRQLYR